MLATYLAVSITISTAFAPALVGQSTASNKIITGEIQAATRYEITVAVKSKGSDKTETITLAITSETDISIDRKGAGRDKLAKGQVGTFLFDSVEEEALNVKVSTPEDIARREEEKKKEEMEAAKSAKDDADVRAKIAAQRAKEAAERKAVAARIAGLKAFYGKIADRSVLGMELPAQEDCAIAYTSKVARELQAAAVISKEEYQDKLAYLLRNNLVGMASKGTMMRVIEASTAQRGYSKDKEPLPILVKCRILESPSANDKGREVWVIAGSIAPPLGDKELVEIDGSDPGQKGKAGSNSKGGKVTFFGIDADGSTESDSTPEKKSTKKKNR